MKPIKCCATCIHYWNCKYKNCRSNNWEHWESEYEKEARKWVKEHTEIEYKASYGECPKEPSAIKSFKAGAEFGYNKAKEEIQEKNYSLFDFVMQYENGKFKCKYKSGKEFESVDGKTWKEIVLPELKESEFKSELFPKITLPKGSSELVDKVIADAEKRIKESE